MARTLLALLFLQAFDRVQSVAFPQPLPTTAADNVVDAIRGWSPKPTEGPRIGGRPDLRRKDAPGIAARELFGRQNAVNTCGWYNADVNEPQTCSFGSACAYFSASKPAIFTCCPTVDGEIDWDNCPYYAYCRDHGNSTGSTYSGSYEAIGASSTIMCGTASTACATIFLTDTQSSTYIWPFCYGTSEDFYLYQYTTDPTSSAPSSNPVPSSVPQQHSISIVTQTVTKHGKGGKNAASSSSATAGPTGKNKGGSSSSTNTGAIAGGVVGGVAGVALIGTAIGYLIYRKRKQRVEPMREVSIYSNNYPNSNSYQNSNNYPNGNGYQQ